jgi:hypothetical protein
MKSPIITGIKRLEAILRPVTIKTTQASEMRTRTPLPVAGFLLVSASGILSTNIANH